MNQFKIDIGDWSNDGHGVCHSFLVETAKTVEDAREAHFKIEEKTGVNLHSFVNDYEDATIQPEVLHKLLKIPGLKEEFEEDLRLYGFTKEKADLIEKFPSSANLDKKATIKMV